MIKHARIFVIVGVLSATQIASAFYDANLGRWLNRDPIGEEGSLNLYAFVNNSPIQQYDRDGLTPGPDNPGFLSQWNKEMVDAGLSIFAAGQPFASKHIGIVSQDVMRNMA